ncbi:hypothetical protein EDB19DRAFT_1954365, partial [Suillus lakei]
MSNILRVFSKHVHPLSQLSKAYIVALNRSFYSPFVVLNSPLTSPALNMSPMLALLYKKQHDHSPELQISSAGMCTYVVSEPDPANMPHAVPSGTYPTTAPYVNFTPMDMSNPEGKHSSSSVSLPHPYTTRAVHQNADGIGKSASVRYGEAPGEM